MTWLETYIILLDTPAKRKIGVCLKDLSTPSLPSLLMPRFLTLVLAITLTLQNSEGFRFGVAKGEVIPPSAGLRYLDDTESEVCRFSRRKKEAKNEMHHL